MNIWHIYCIQDAFDPAGIEFNTFPVMAKHIVKAMLPEQNGEVHKLSLHAVPRVRLCFSIFLHIVLHTAAYSVYCNMKNMQNMNPALFICIFCWLFCILFCIHQHIVWHIQHILHIAICKICRIWTLHYLLAYCLAYSAYYFAYICINMQNNMQPPKSICRTVQVHFLHIGDIYALPTLLMVLEEYKGARKSGHIMHFCIFCIF